MALALWRWLWALILCAHAVLAGFWAWVAPGGFPPGHLRFWSNRPLPLAVIALAVWGISSMLRRTDGLLRSAGVAVAILWLAAAVVGWTLFPISTATLGPLALAGGLLLGLLALVPLRATTALPRRWWVTGVMLASAIAGGLFPLSQRAPEPDTRPLGGRPPAVRGGVSGTPAELTLAPGLTFRPGEASVTVRSGTRSLELSPLLTFESRSPDRCWTLLARPLQSEGSPRTLTALEAGPGSAGARYLDDGVSTLVVQAPAGPAIGIESWSRLDRSVYSHLNEWCSLVLMGHHRATVEFSPCPGLRVTPEPADYPVGRPARLAYLASGGAFRIVQASTGEKGPFKTLGAGHLERGEPIELTILDESVPVFRLTWDDWSAQLSTVLSPTAGWGLPMNSIELERLGNSPGAPIQVRLCLAATSVGRGWDSVGHAPGLYRSRIRIDRLP